MAELTSAPEPTVMERAIEAFVNGFAFTRSFTHPYAAERIGPVWVMRDAPRTRGDYRNEEWVAHGVSPAEIHNLAIAHTRGRYAVCLIHGSSEPDAPLREELKAIGYRLTTTEPLMVHPLREIPSFESPATVERVRSKAMADRLAKAARARQVLPQHLNDDSHLRQYVALINGELVGWVRSIVVGDATWCSNMFVTPESRRRGIARALLGEMLRDDRDAGAAMAVLLASHAGAKLYPPVGYEQIGTLLLFVPRKS